ncbi:U-box domain-containing protein 45 [Acorus calamus]|uniref:U-box domain-containing protein 45 n=1 Tax=Acorus calamus TaxID=4465 RepID=A0AAV9EQU2_ACOCL|nr:U-box domain-containing protein 45 [Acorus calamus]
MGQNPNPNLNHEEEVEVEDEEGEGEDRRQRSLRKLALVHDLSRSLSHGDPESRVRAARDVRRLARSSARSRSILAAPSVVQPLVSMLLSSDGVVRESALLALLNLAVRNERNKDRIVKSGAIPPLVEILKQNDGNLRDLATAAILSLSVSPSNKQPISNSGVTPLLIDILNSGSIQGKVDAVTALCNLYISPDNNPSPSTLTTEAIPPLLSLLKDCKKHSKFAEKATALLEILSSTEGGQTSISKYDGGILAIVETIEGGTLISTEHAVGVLLMLCRSRRQYRRLVLEEGAIPGLLRLTIDGTEKGRERAVVLLDLLREEARPRRRLFQCVIGQSLEERLNHLQLGKSFCSPSVGLV